MSTQNGKTLRQVLNIGLNAEFLIGIPDKKNLKISMLALMYHGFIDDRSVSVLQSIIKKTEKFDPIMGIDPFIKGTAPLEVSDDYFKEFFSILNSNMKRKIKYADCKEMFEKLEEYSVPVWIEEKYQQLYDMLPHLRFVGDESYFVANENGLFRNHGTTKLTADKKIENEKTISLTFNQILGKDDKNTIYAGIKGNSEIYMEYHTEDTKAAEVIRKGQFLGLLKGIDPVVIKDNQLLIIEGETSRVLTSVRRNEKYSVLHNSMLVEGKGPAIIRPYEISNDGNRIEYSRSKWRKYLIRQFLDWLFCNSVSDAGMEREIQRYNTECISLNDLTNNLGKYKSFDESIRDMLSMLEIFKKYMDSSEDITDFLYGLFDAILHLDRLYVPQKCTPKALHVIQMLDSKNELDPLNEWEELYGTLMEYAYWDEEKLSQYYSTDKNLFIGCFKLQDGRLHFLKQKYDKGALVGNCYVYQTGDKEMKGSVVYDLKEDKLIFQYYRALSKAETNLLVSKYNPQGEAYSIRIYP